MTRLTKRDEFGNADIIGVDSADLQCNLEFDDLNKVTEALNKLAKYEDTKLSPDEVEVMKEDFYPAEAAVYLRECAKKDTGWIPCSEKLPEEPPEIPVFTEEIEQMLNDGKLKEYIVMIRDAETPTTLCYIGLNVWHDIVTQDCYEVIAWQPLPEPYIPEGGETP